MFEDKMTDKIIEIINGFVIRQKFIDNPNTYYEAKRGGKVFTSHSLSYLKKKVKTYGL